jgi:hypothetical protein
VQLSFLLNAGGLARVPWASDDSESVDEDGLFWTSVESAMIRGSGVGLCCT